MQKLINKAAVKDALLQKGWTQAQLAKAVGVSAQSVTNWLKGKDFPRPALLLKIASNLALDFDQLVEPLYSGRPIIAFRKKGGAKTTAEHIARAVAIGQLLRPLVPYLPEVRVLRPLIPSPSTHYNKLQTAVSETRAKLGLGELAVLDYEHLIAEFNGCGAVLIPVLWGEKSNHENALHIRLPQEDVTFILLNLDTRIEDFKFWMAHELAHVYTPELAGSNEGEDFADAFAGALLFPRACAESVYREVSRVGTEATLAVLKRYASKHDISLNTVYREVCGYAKNSGLPDLGIDEKTIHAIRNSQRGPLVSEALFDPMPPEPDRYLAACEHVFQTGFFQAATRMIHETHTGPGYLQQVLNISLTDAMALHEALDR